jgi:large subunit ribosomal protein L7e
MVTYFAQQPHLPSQKIPFKRAEKFIKEFRLKQKDSVRLSRQARWHRPSDNIAPEPKLIVAIRIRK